MLCRSQCAWISGVSPKLKVLGENTNLHMSARKPAPFITSCWCSSSFGSPPSPAPFSLTLQQGGEHGREVNTGRCCLSVGFLGKHPLPQAEPSCCPQAGGDLHWRLCHEAVESQAADMQWERSTPTLRKAEVAPVCLGSRKQPVHHQLKSTAF